MSKLIELAITLIKMGWEKRPMRRRKDGNKTMLVVDLNTVGLVLTILAGGFYAKNQLGYKSGTEVALSEIKAEIAALRTENRAIFTNIESITDTLSDKTHGLDALDRRVAILEATRRTRTAEEIR
jgi:hypothetical protein